MVGERAHVEVVDGQVLGGDPDLGRRLAHLLGERVGRKAFRQRAGRDRERDVADLGAGLDEPRHRAAAAELAVVGVRREHERPLDVRDHARASRRAARRAPRARPGRGDPRWSGLRRARCRTGSARGSRSRLLRTRDATCRRSRGRAAGSRRASAVPASQSRSASPGSPVSAATVIGVVCDAAAFGSLPFRPLSCCVRVLEPADADAEHRVMLDDLQAGRDELRAAARDVRERGRRLALEPVADLRRAEPPATRSPRRAQRRRERRPGGARRPRRSTHTAREERGEARLRERRQQPGPRDPDRQGQRDHPERVRPAQHDHEARRRSRRRGSARRSTGRRRRCSRGRTSRSGRRRCRRSPSGSRRCRAPRTGRSRSPRRRAPSRRAVRRAPSTHARDHGEPRQREREQAERQHEEEQLDRSLLHVLRPEQAQAVPADERRDRPGERPELAGARLLAVELPGERERGDDDDAVDRQQEVRLGRADVDRDARRNAGERRARPAARARAARARRRPPPARRPTTAAAASRRWWPCGAR